MDDDGSRMVEAHLTAFGERVPFIADDGIHGREIWITDRAPTGTRLVRDVRP